MMAAPMLERPGVLRYGDLVVGPQRRGVPWVPGGTDPATGLDCKGLAYLLLQRAGLDVPQHALIGSEAAALGDSAEAWRRYLAEQEALWTPVPAAERLGDLVVSHAEDGAVHLAVLVDEPRRRALTTSRATGVVLVPVWSIIGVREVLRFAGGGGGPTP